MTVPKEKGRILVDSECPIVGLHDCEVVDELDEWDTETIHTSAASLVERVYLKPMEA